MHDDKHLVLVSIDENERPVSIRTLGAYAESLGVRTTLLVIIKKLARIGDPVAFSSREVGALHAWLVAEKVTHLGFSLMTASLRPYEKLTHALREAGYRGVIMAGGVHVSLCPEESLVDGAEYAVQGPGELPLKMVLEGAEPTSIPGLIWRRDGLVVVNDKADSQKLDLDTLPYPIFRFDKDMILVDGRLRRLTWSLHRKHASWDGRYYDMLTSRGCVYRCAYCCNVNGAPVRRSSVDRVIGELKSVRERSPKTAGVNFQDDSFFTGSEAWIDEFCSRMPAEIGLPFIVRMIPAYVTRERVERLKAAGLDYVTMGLEASDRMNKTLFNRRETAESFLKAAKIIHEAGVYLSVDIIINNPYETEDDLRQMALTLNALPRPNWGVVALSLTAFPSTPLYARAKRDNMLERFVTDPYDSMLIPSRPNGYLTPRFWLLLNTKLLPVVSQSVGARLISADAQSPQVLQLAERLNRQMGNASRIAGFLGAIVPWLRPAARRVMKKVVSKRKG